MENIQLLLMVMIRTILSFHHFISRSKLIDKSLECIFESTVCILFSISLTLAMRKINAATKQLQCFSDLIYIRVHKCQIHAMFFLLLMLKYTYIHVKIDNAHAIVA